jgi:glutamate-1-semialdehyde 2,1-aminomutase
MKEYTFTKSYEMFEKAKELVPGGIYGPRSPNFLTFGSYPAFLQRGKGCHIWDVDEYIDYMCSFGTNVLGLQHPKVDAAAKAQMEKGDCFTLPSDLWLDTAQAMVDKVDFAAWTVFGKNGSDVTNFAVRLARHKTGKKLILMAQGSYHGIGPWCVPITAGIPSEYTDLTKKFNYNDPESVRKAFDEFAGQIDCVVLTPMKHDTFVDIEYPTKEFLATVRECCDKEEALLISDDIRCGFRLNLGGSHEFFGYEPDLACFGKAIANGYAIATLVGKEELKVPAQSIYFSGTHFFSGVAMAAMIASLKALEEENAIEQMKNMGNLLREGIEDKAKKHDIEISYSGPPAIPYLVFGNDISFNKARYFCGEAAKRGIFLHPHHNWFLCAAHKTEDIEKTIDVIDICFGMTKEKFADDK